MGAGKDGRLGENGRTTALLNDPLDYYALLQVTPDATQEELRSAYKRLAFLYHPDHSDQPDANERMKLLNEAYAVLSNQEKRYLYDLERERHEEPTQPVRTQPERAAQEVEREPAPAPAQAQEAQPRPARPSKFWMELEPRLIRLTGWVREPLKVLYYLFAMILVLFLWAMLTGRVNFFALALVILASLWLIFSVVFKLKNPGASKR